ncbi:hypothetical protein MLD38_025120 [Melastoma candidum]|uniref:Uncharacterized protein n=1 Tax=Melastoma candidum TaxID=119954 RepID=A0ACB9P186_9MYRT|nr:hypothetical protein MLD38_025120 [Melastoma candidum]
MTKVQGAEPIRLLMNANGTMDRTMTIAPGEGKEQEREPKRGPMNDTEAAADGDYRSPVEENDHERNPGGENGHERSPGEKTAMIVPPALFPGTKKATMTTMAAASTMTMTMSVAAMMTTTAALHEPVVFALWYLLISV